MRQKIILAAAFLAIVFSFSACGSKKVDISDYLQNVITVSGADGYGKVTQDDLADVILVENIVNNCLTSKNSNPLSVRFDLYDDLTLELNQDYENLKNGDKIEITLTYDEAAFKAYGIRFKNKSGDVLEYEIHDLPELGSFDPFEDLDYTITGYNGYATIEVSNKSEDNIDSIYTSFYIEDEENKSLNTKSKLSNGDKLKVHPYSGYTTEEDYINYCIENLLSKPTRTEMEIEVKDLKDPKKIDIFSDKYLDISVSGISGYGNLTINKKDDNGIYYHVSKESYLSNGDEVTITASTHSWSIFDDEETLEDVTYYCLNNLDAIPKDFTYTYTVEGLDYYATALRQIPEDVMNQMKNQADDIRTEEFASSTKESLISSDYLGAYLLCEKNIQKHPSYGDSYNRVYLIYKNKISNPDGEFTYYWYINFDDIIVGNDESVEVNVLDCDYPRVNNVGALSTKSGFYYPGYEKFDVMYEKLVNSKLDYYDCDSTVKE